MIHINANNKNVTQIIKRKLYQNNNNLAENAAQKHVPRTCSLLQSGNHFCSPQECLNRTRFAVGSYFSYRHTQHTHTHTTHTQTHPAQHKNPLNHRHKKNIVCQNDCRLDSNKNKQ